jgi:hypothetical protein
MTILLVEQDVSQALAVASYVHCLLEGRVTLAGPPAALTGEQIEMAYFGAAAGSNGKAGPAGQAVAADSDQPPGVRT